jgi:NADH-quinone oxidoreductase subunit M
MILVVILFVLIAGAALSLLASKWSSLLPRYIALLALGIDAIILLGSWNLSAFPALFHNSSGWIYEYRRVWIPAFGINIHLAIDGLSYIMLLLTLVMGFVSIMASPKTEQEGFYYFNTLIMITGVAGIFLAIDLFLFFFFWEMMLVPLYLLMVQFGKSGESKSSFKFLLYTQGSGLILLVSILALFFVHGKGTGLYTFDYLDFMGYSMGFKASSLIMLGFLIAFLVKLPVLPFHGWLPGAFVDAPITAVITGLMIKTGAYGIIRFAIPLFPEASTLFSSTAFVIGAITILYGALMAFSQDDLRLIAAYSGISHMGFILIGLYSFNEIGWQGVIVQMIASAISTSALVILASSLLKRTGTCNVNQLGGLWEKVPVLSGLGMFFALASLGLPGMGNFIAEFLILLGTFKVSIVIAVVASLGLVAAAAYSLRIIQKVFVGKKNSDRPVSDFSPVEKLSMGVLAIGILWLGFHPQPILNRSKPVVEKILNATTQPKDNPMPREKDEASVKIQELVK